VVRAREVLDRLAPYVPAPSAADGSLIRLATNEHPDGPFPAARAALAEHAGLVHRYPELDGRLIERLATLHGVGPEMVALGNGADAIIGYLSAAFLEPGDEVLTGWPSFPTYVTDARKQGAESVLVPLADGALDLEALAERISAKTRLIWVCTPNNPTGGAVGADALTRFLDAVPEHVLVVVDEAYVEYTAPAPEPAAPAGAGPGSRHVDAIRDHVRERPNVGSLRTFSKIYGLAGLRIGYFVGPAPVARALGQVRHYYDIGELSTIAALASLDQPEELERRRVANLEHRALLERGLARLGLNSLSSETNFVAVEVDDADATAAALLAAGIDTRSLSGLGEPGLLRVTVGSPPQIERLLTALGSAPAG
jgi:histidinol-phosphate aminotransferase